MRKCSIFKLQCYGHMVMVVCSLTRHLKLDNLILIYDDNNIQIDGNTSLTFTQNVGKRYKS